MDVNDLNPIFERSREGTIEKERGRVDEQCYESGCGFSGETYDVWSDEAFLEV